MIDGASAKIHVAAPWLEDKDIADALIRAKSRLVETEVVVDSGFFLLDETKRLINNFIPVHPRAENAFMNSFIIVSDDTAVFTGSAELGKNGSNSFSTGFMIIDGEYATRFEREFHILRTGIYTTDKDIEFDLRMGPFGDMFESSWYLENQIMTDMGTIKGRWDSMELATANSGIKPYFTPYQKSVSEYGYYTPTGSGTYTAGFVTHNYHDHEHDIDTTENRTDFINVLVPLISSAEDSISIFAFILGDGILVDEIIKASGRGVKIEIYLDYDMTLNRRAYIPLTLAALKTHSEKMMLCRPDGGSLLMNVIIIDSEIMIVDSAGFTTRSFIDNDTVINIISGNSHLFEVIRKTVIRLTRYSSEYKPDFSYPDDFQKYDFHGRL